MAGLNIGFYLGLRYAKILVQTEEERRRNTHKGVRYRFGDWEGEDG
jgi:hypothetical protein